MVPMGPASLAVKASRFSPMSDLLAAYVAVEATMNKFGINIPRGSAAKAISEFY